jgi:hypothetical protein
MSTRGYLILALTVTMLDIGCSRGCVSSPSPTKETPMLDSRGRPIQHQPRDVRLACDVKWAGDKLSLHFEIRNASDEPIHVFDDRGRGDFQPNILCDGGGGAVHVLFGVPQIPPGVEAYWKFHPKATKLQPGASLHRESSVAVPLRERGTYAPVDYLLYAPVEITRLVLRVDFLRASKVVPSEYPDEPFGELESVSCEARLPGPVELQRRSDRFHRI